MSNNSYHDQISYAESETSITLDELWPKSPLKILIPFLSNKKMFRKTYGVISSPFPLAWAACLSLASVISLCGLLFYAKNMILSSFFFSSSFWNRTEEKRSLSIFYEVYFYNLFAYSSMNVQIVSGAIEQ